MVVVSGVEENRSGEQRTHGSSKEVHAGFGDHEWAEEEVRGLYGGGRGGEERVLLGRELMLRHREV